MGDRIGRHSLLAVALLLAGATVVQAGEVCKAYFGGDKSRAEACADETISELTDRDQYNLAVGSLSGIGEPAIPSLLRALKSSEWLVRAAASDALGRIGVRLEKPEEVVNALGGSRWQHGR